MDDRLPAVLTEIRSLLDLASGERPPRPVVEETLTSGYAYALGLEGERFRIERSLRETLRSSSRADAAELADLSGRLENVDRELAGVRALLASLRAQALT